MTDTNTPLWLELEASRLYPIANEPYGRRHKVKIQRLAHIRARMMSMEDMVGKAWDAAVERTWWEIDPDKPEPVGPPDKASFIKKIKKEGV